MKNYNKTYAAPKRRNIVAVGAFQRTGAGVHKAMVKAGPQISEWDWDETEEIPVVEVKEVVE